MNARPMLIEDLDISIYDTIFVGYPIGGIRCRWLFGVFFENKDFCNKRIIPYCTHEGGGIGLSVRDMRLL